MSFFKKLFGGGTAETAKSEVYNGFTITPTPQKEGTQYRIGARIEKEIGGQVHTHTLVRADTIADPQEAADASVAKARQMIDEQGDRIFG